MCGGAGRVDAPPVAAFAAPTACGSLGGGICGRGAPSVKSGACGSGGRANTCPYAAYAASHYVSQRQRM